MGPQPSRKQPTDEHYQEGANHAVQPADSADLNLNTKQSFQVREKHARIKAAGSIILSLPEWERFSLSELLVLCLPKMHSPKTSLIQTVSTLVTDGYLKIDNDGYYTLNLDKCSQHKQRIQEHHSSQQVVSARDGSNRLRTPLRDLIISLDPNTMPMLLGLATRFEKMQKCKTLNSETIESALRDMIKAGWLIDCGGGKVRRYRKIPSIGDAKSLIR